MKKTNILKSFINFIKNSFIVSISLFLVCACSVKLRKSVSSKNSIDDRRVVVKSDSNMVAASNSQIIFLNYKVTKNINGEIEIDLINKIVKSGKLKNEIRENDNYVSGDLKFIELDGNSMPINSFHIPNPLRKRVEYVNKSRELESKLLELDSTVISVRIQLNPNSKFITIDEVDDLGKKTSKLIITKIK